MATKQKTEKGWVGKSIETGQLKWFVIGGGVLMVAVGLGIWYAVRKLKQSKRERQIRKIEEKTHIEGSLEAVAKIIAQEAEKPFYLDSDESLVIETIKKYIKTQEDYNKLIDIYKKLTGKNLNEELAKFLDQNELQTIRDILELKPQRIDRNQKPIGLPDYDKKAEEYADEIHKIIEGIDVGIFSKDSCIRLGELFEKITDKSFFEKVKQKYENKYGNFWEDIWDEWNVRLGFRNGQNCGKYLENYAKSLK
ncbi:MAG: hypothetical protein RMJ97_06990 [Raineya sp.]|nr:hypothetical protein [Raineya sp.]MDW8296615.1 hypothetical protein [Raineya sp.]